MKSIILHNSPMSLSGSSLLNEIQNTHTPLLDLLVRESIQNSLDAGRFDKEYVDVGFDLKTISTYSLSPFFPEISPFISENSTFDCLSIRDVNAEGLSGGLSKSDISKGNYGKLVCSIRNGQTKEGAGGSWGIGKTIYFKLGIGLVIYYSSIEISRGEYEERLAAILVEDERSASRLYKEDKNYIGIIFWGEYDESIHNDNFIRPIRNKSQIQAILESLHIKRYNPGETGTTIIVPYIDRTKLLENAKGSDELRWFPRSVEEYLKLAIQRWYAPRLNNAKYRGRTRNCFLRASVNGEGVRLSYPFFNLISNLYNRDESDTEIVSKQISLRGEFSDSSVAGILNFVLINETDLKMVPPNNFYDPFTYLGKREYDGEAGNDVILACVRKPGMIVDYFSDGFWVKGVPKTEPGKYLVALFTAEGSTTLKTKEKTLEDYLRSLELADHFDWKDTDDGIASKIKRNVSKHLRDYLKSFEKHNEEGTANYTFARLLASKLLPHGSAVKKGDGREEGTRSYPPHIFRSRHVKLLQIGDPDYIGHLVYLPVHIHIPDAQTVFLTLEAKRENETMSLEVWENDMGRKSKLKLIDFQIHTISYPQSKENRVVPLISTISQNTIDQLTVCNYFTPKRTKYRIGITSRYDKCDITGLVIYSTDKIEGSLTLEREERV